MKMKELSGLFLSKETLQHAADPATPLSECLKTAMRGNDDVVITIGTIRDGRKEWSVYGKDGSELPEKQHDYEIASITKTVTATLAAKAVSAGLIRIDDPIDRYLDLPKEKNYPTVRQLLTHTAGYNSFYYDKPMAGNILSGRGIFNGITGEMLLHRAAELNIPACSHPFNYSNFGVSILGLILETVFEEKYTILANRFLQETGMVHSRVFDGKGDLGGYYEWDADNGYLPAGGIMSNIEDMLLYAQKQLENQGIFAMTHETLSKVTVTRKNRLLVSMGINEVAMNWAKDTENHFIWHSGDIGIYHSYLGFCPETESAVVVLGKLTTFDYTWPLTIGTKILKEFQQNS